MEYLDKWASFGKLIKFLQHTLQKYFIRFSLESLPKSKIKNQGSQKTWPDRAKLSIQFSIFHQTLPA